MTSAATYPVATVAKLLLLTERRVQQLTKDGVLPRAERGRYELAPVVQSYVGYLRDRSLPGADEAASDAFHRARARRMTAEANLSEMRDAEARGELISAADVRAVLSSVIVRVRAKLLSIPPRLAPRVVGCTSLTDAEEAIRHGVHDALDELAGTQIAGVVAIDVSDDDLSDACQARLRFTEGTLGGAHVARHSRGDDDVGGMPPLNRRMSQQSK